MHKQTRHDRDEVHAQLLSQVGWVMHVQDLPCHKEHNAKGEVPVCGEEIMIVDVVVKVLISHFTVGPSMSIYRTKTVSEKRSRKK